MEWLLFLYPISLAINKNFNTVISVLLLVSACFCFKKVDHARVSLNSMNRLWVLALCLPIITAILQHFMLTPPLRLRDFDDLSRYLLCIPVFFAMTIVRPRIQPFLWGCVIFLAYTIPLMFWHVHIKLLDRDIAPNGYLGIIPHTSLAVIFGFMTFQLATGPGNWLKHRLLPIFLLLSIVAIPMLSQTRSGLLLALSMAVLLWVLLPGRSIKALLYGGAVVAIVVALILGSKHFWSRSDNTLNEIVEYSEQQKPVPLTSATTRIELWRIAGKMFSEHPWIGVGNNRFRTTLSNYQKVGEVSPQLSLYSHPHNEILKFAAEDGMFGVLSLALLYFVPLTVGIRGYRRAPSARNPALLLIVFSTGFIVSGLVDVILDWHSVIMFYGIISSLLIANVDAAAKKEPV